MTLIVVVCSIKSWTCSSRGEVRALGMFKNKDGDRAERLQNNIHPVVRLVVIRCFFLTIAMWFLCRCLNVGVNVDVADEEGVGTVALPATVLSAYNAPLSIEDDVDDPFFLDSTGKIAKANTIGKDAVTMVLPYFVRIREAGSWLIHHCHLCDMDVYASRPEFPSELYINLTMLVSAV
ncbi:unnamed protein product [Soboliphyme baturini]|uniref:Secreted protein n=1 Tax=Soboliphyme baturini TaxID=241478 RepID=A0A183IFU0_9BILA|nr:unnamed protein product [Soboliphyme baturini]